MKKALVAAPLLLLAACGGNGWTALPTDDSETCFQIEHWESGWTTRHQARGVFCEARP